MFSFDYSKTGFFFRQIFSHFQCWNFNLYAALNWNILQIFHYFFLSYLNSFHFGSEDFYSRRDIDRFYLVSKQPNFVPPPAWTTHGILSYQILKFISSTNQILKIFPLDNGKKKVAWQKLSNYQSIWWCSFEKKKNLTNRITNHPKIDLLRGLQRS